MNKILVCFVSLLTAAGVNATELIRGETSEVAAVSDGDTITLKSGTVVRLIGLQAPKLPLRRAGFKAWPMAEQARETLEALVLDETVTLYFGGTREDRYGRVLAQLKRDDDLWVQGEMIRLGMARVYSFRDNRACVRHLLALENEARAAGRGIWSDDWYRVRGVRDTFRELDSYQIVEARIQDTSITHGRVFLNYGSSWRDDFTVTVAPRDVSLFEDAGIDLLNLAGVPVRVRGWLTYYNGPNLEATHPEQIELLEAAVGEEEICALSLPRRIETGTKPIN